MSDEGQGVGSGCWGWFELRRQSLPPSLLLMPAYYHQGGWPLSCKLSIHDVVINVLGYRAILPVYSLSSL